jgi:secreted trypsin-like serine protease
MRGRGLGLVVTTAAFMLALIGTSVAAGGLHGLASRVPTTVSHRDPAAIPSLRSVRGSIERFSNSIIGGSTANVGSFPWLAFIYYSDANGLGSLCTGTVIAPTLILTAGHCAVSENTGQLNAASGYSIATGSLDWSDETTRQVSGVSRVLVDPNYNPLTVQSDAALLVLSAPTTAPTIPLATSSDIATLTPGTLSAVAGWGQTVPNEPSSTPYLVQWATTVVQRPVYCEQHAQSFDPETELCAVDAPYDDTAACFGDSGGPLVANYLSGQSGNPVEVGITSRTINNCDTSQPAIFTRVDAISSWANRWIAVQATDPQAPSGSAATPPSRPSLPRMTPSLARSYAMQTARGAFPRHFSHRFYSSSCVRGSTTRFECGVNWSAGPNDYYGTVKVFYEFFQASAVWSDHYSIRWVNDWCYFRSGHRRRCSVHRAQGSY